MRRTAQAFTLIEMLVAVAVLAMIVVLVARAVNSVSAITSTASRRIETDTQVRPLFDRMAIDLAQMVKRPDVDFFGKGTALGGVMNGNDRIAFFSMVPGDYPSSGSPSPFSLISYKINSSGAVANKAIFTRLQRMARGLLMNGDASANNGTSPSLIDGPIFFSPISIQSIWTTTVTSNATTDSKHELIGPNLLRFEYYYLLTSGSFSVVPWDTALAGHTTAAGLRDVAAVIVAVAAVDPKTRVLFDNTTVSTVSGTLVDYSAGGGHGPGWLTAQWRASLDSPTNATVKTLSRSAVAAIRVYERYFYLAPTVQ
jgi:prepilin-type N-terminal cleavage/methylation domain-containing protein